MVNGWKYYNHALLPDCAPNESPDISKMREKEFWDNDTGAVLLARWTSDFDCQQEQNWWYLIKDDIFDVSLLKAKRRYEITKGKRNFEVKRIDPKQYVEDIINILIKAYEQYPVQYRPSVDAEKIHKDMECVEENVVIFGAFHVETNAMVGYAMMIENESYVNFAMLKVIPEFEKLGINAAMVAGILEHYNSRIENGYYICDGERALFHETKFQDYLEKYFGFRKAYAKLHVKFVFPLSFCIVLLRPFKKIISKMNNGMIKKINVLLLFDELSK